MEPVVSLRSVVALLGRFPALTGVDLDLGAQEIVLVTGPNGAGKTTLLRVCAGLVPIASGAATAFGVDLRHDPAAVRPVIGLLGHQTGMYDELSPVDNLRFWARAARVDRADVPAALDRAGVAPRLFDVPVARLSTGQRRRVSLAGLILRRPRLWLLDEPHAGLDQAGRDHLDTLVGEAAAAGATVLFTSHELDRAHRLATRSVELSGGGTNSRRS